MSKLPPNKQDTTIKPSREKVIETILEPPERHAGGRPSKYSDEMNKKSQEYLEGKIQTEDIPYIEELAIELKVHRETILNWSNENSEFFDTIKALEDFQKFKLQKESLRGKYNATAAIFQLKANHGMIETEKKILAGDKDEPITVEIKDYGGGEITDEII